MIYVDNLNIYPLHRARVIEELGRFVDRSLVVGDRVMIASADPALSIRQPFTGDRALISTAIAEELGRDRAQGNRYEAERRGLLETLETISTSLEAVEAVRPYASRVFEDLMTTLEVLEELVDHLAGLPGRRVVLHVSSGLPILAAADLFWAIENRFYDGFALHRMADFVAAEHFERVAARANTIGVTLHALEAGGLGADGPAVDGYDVAVARMRGALGRDRRENRQASLRLLANRTGGHALLNRNDVPRALERVAADLHTYYWLGYSPGEQIDGSHHSIAVRVKRDGVEVRHREGYRYKRPATRSAESVRAALLHGFHDNRLGIVLRVGEPVRHDESSFAVPFRVAVPIDRLVLVPDGDDYVGRVQVYVGAMDSTGRIARTVELPLEITVPRTADDGDRTRHWEFSHALVMPADTYTIAIGVLDELGAESAIVTDSIEVRDRDPASSSIPRTRDP